MPNIIDTNGIQIKTLDEIKAEIIAALKLAYGDDINVDQDSPDGQLINIFAQSVKDVEDLIVQVYNSFSPDLAIGKVLDQRVAINGIQRLGGTFTITPITVVTDRALSLTGLDLDINNPDGVGYTISDSQGNQWILTETTAIPAAGSHVLNFRAKNNGAVQTVPNTINIAVSVVLGVTSVNNPTTYTTLGLNEETDAALRLRRQQSVSLASQGYLASLQAELLNISGVTYAKIYENITGAVDGDGIPSHSIWVIIEGGIDDDIAYAIYTKRNAGCGMKGSVSVVITQPDGTPFSIQFDRTSTEDLYIKFDAESINGIDPVDSTYIKAQLVSMMSLGVNESVNINDIVSMVRDIDANTLVTSPQVSNDGMTWQNIASPSAKNKRFTLQAANINITVVP